MKRDEDFATIALEYEAAEFIKKYPEALTRPESFRMNLSRADTALIKDLNRKHTNASDGSIKVGTKMSKIKNRAIQWNNRSDEVLELKKIFYEFIKKLVESKENSNKTELTLYERYDTDEYYTLDNLIGLGG